MPRFARHGSRKLALSALVLVSTALSACGTTWGQRIHDNRSVLIDHEQGRKLEIVNANGSIRATHDDRDEVSVHAELYGEDAERLRFARLRTEREGDGTLRVWVEWPGGNRRNNEGARIEIYTPGVSGVKATSTNGSITLIGLGGDAYAVTSNGSVFVDEQGGSVEAVSTNGPIRVEEAGGKVFVETSNGAVIVGDAQRAVDVRTTNGRVSVETAHGNEGPVRAKTTNGSVDISLGEDFEGRLVAHCSTGRISVTGFEEARLIRSKPDALELRIGNSDEESAIHTTNGSIRIRSRDRD